MRFTLEEIIQHTGLPTEKVSEICSLLVLQGYLIFEKTTSHYRLTNDEKLRGRVNQLWNQCKDERTFEQMSTKIEDIIQFGKPLALSEKNNEPKVRNIGIPGLNIIFGNSEVNQSSDQNGVNYFNIPGIPKGHCILIKGAPGTGKTTLGMQIVLHLKNRRSRFLTFEEDINQLVQDFHNYLKVDDRGGEVDSSGKPHENKSGWRKSDIQLVTCPLTRIRTPKAWHNPDTVIEELISIFDYELPHLVVIDSISRFRDLGGNENARMILRRLIRSLKCRRITAIFLAEDRKDEFPFEDYDVDGVIHLGWTGDHLNLSVKKMRGMKAYKGPHSAALMPVEEFDPIKKYNNHLIFGHPSNSSNPSLARRFTVGFNVFPEISVFKDIPLNIEDKMENHLSAPFSTGTPGLDNLLIMPKNQKGLKRGETALLVGSAGAGKTLLSLNFALNGFGKKSKKENRNENKPEHSVWINLEGEYGTLEFAVRGFEGEYKDDIENMLKFADPETRMKANAEWEKEKNSRFDFIDFPPINLDLNKMVYTLEAFHRRFKIHRLVIDSITELERAKGTGQPEVKVFLAGLIQFLRRRNITTLFVCRSDAFFRSIDKIEEQVSSLVDLIICIRNFDIHNQIQKGIYIQKARGRQHNSKIMRLNIDSKRGIEVEDSGWDLENLLAGDSSSIDKPTVFFKLFFENPAESFINQEIINDFDTKRYPGDDPKFSLVKKPSIYTEFWSFKGQFSAGHANTRVLSIADHVISAFRDNNRLANLEKYVKSEVWQNIINEKHLSNRYPSKVSEEDEPINHYLTLKMESQPKKKVIDAVPSYRDYGVMIFRTDIEYQDGKKSKKIIATPYINPEWGEYLKSLKNYSDKFLKEDNGNFTEYTWEKLRDQLVQLNQKKSEDKRRINDICGNEILPFAMPPLERKSEFVAFFMELLWSYGGDIYKPDILCSPFEEEGKKFEEMIQNSIFIEFVNYCQFRKINTGETPKTYLSNKIDEIIGNLEITKLDQKSDHDILERFEKRCSLYGFEHKDIDFNEFKSWIIKEGLKKIVIPGSLENSSSNEPKEIEEKIIEALQKESVLLLNGAPFEKSIRLLLELVHKAGVKNPIDGEFRHAAIFSRNWYSRAASLITDKCNYCFKNRTENCQEVKSGKKNLYETQESKNQIALPKIDTTSHLLPLPLGKLEHKLGNETIHFYRSATCFTYWSLVMLNNALSPEIGGNFIESMNAPEYYQKRLKYRLGIPVMNQEIEKKNYTQFHPESYSILRRTIKGGEKYQSMRTKINKACKKIDKNVKKNKADKDAEKKEEIKKIISNNYSFLCSEFIGYINQELTQRETQNKSLSLDKLEESINRHLFHPKVRQSRTAFYQLEHALHFQLKQLFTYESTPPDQGIYSLIDEKNIYRRIEKAFSPEKEGVLKSLIGEIEREFRTHVIFELLTYFFHKYQQNKDKAISPIN